MSSDHLSHLRRTGRTAARCGTYEWRSPRSTISCLSEPFTSSVTSISHTTCHLLDMTQREIPGFYYGKSWHVCDKKQRGPNDFLCIDAEKRKYFRVQANHVAPQGAKYSQENVRKEKEQSRVSLSHFQSGPSWTHPSKGRKHLLGAMKSFLISTKSLNGFW